MYCRCRWRVNLASVVVSQVGIIFKWNRISVNNNNLQHFISHALAMYFFLSADRTTAKVNPKKVSGKQHNPPYHYRFHRSWWRGVVFVVVVIINASHFSLFSTVQCRKTNCNNESSWMWLSVVTLVWMEMKGKSFPFASTQACFINKTYITQEVQSTIERW